MALKKINIKKNAPSLPDLIIVKPQPFFLEEETSLEDERYVWAYHISIENQSDSPVKIVKRYWHIVDANGSIQEVIGEGVIGKCPEILPGDSFEYTSAIHLGSPSGVMSGWYLIQDDQKRENTVEIPAFSLDSPFQKICLH